MDKKGQGISMTYIVIAALALIVLIVIFLFFTGALGEMFSRQTEIVEASAEDRAVWISQCKLHCSLEKNEDGNCPSFCSAKFEKDGMVYSCRGTVAGSENLGVECGSTGGYSSSGGAGQMGSRGVSQIISDVEREESCRC